MTKLINFRSSDIAEKALAENIVALERLTDRDDEQVQMHDKKRSETFRKELGQLNGC
jgi:hypothetical protein